jgi:predicted dehydrogenase
MTNKTETTASKRIAVAGVGLIGRRHVAALGQCKETHLSAIADPTEAGRSFAEAQGVPWFESLSDLLATNRPDGVILATPNKVHVDNGLECVAARCPFLVEKPLATTANEAAILVEAARKAGVAMLVGHHRRYNPLIQKAHELIHAGEIGQIRSVQSTCWLFKPDDYFDAAPWRKAAGAGPILVNLVHDIDLLRYLCGDVVSVQAQAAKSIRGFENEDVAAAVLRFESGAIGTITVSDMIVSPWSWEMTARENPAYPPTSQNCYVVGGTLGSLSLPDLQLWQNTTMPSWWEPLAAVTVPRDTSDPLVNQVRHFAGVIDGKEKPLVSGEEGYKTLRLVEAIQTSAATQETVLL